MGIACPEVGAVDLTREYQLGRGLIVLENIDSLGHFEVMKNNWGVLLCPVGGKAGHAGEKGSVCEGGATKAGLLQD